MPFFRGLWDRLVTGPLPERQDLTGTDDGAVDGGDGDQRGWDAVSDATARHHPGARDFHVAYPPGVHFGAPLQGCSAVAGPDHWFYVSYGLTELWDKETDDPTTSGFGYELTLRVPRPPGQDAPPQWPYGAMAAMADYVRHGPQELWLGDRVRLTHPFTDTPGTALTTFAVCPDPVLAPVETPNGRVAFWQLVGLTDADVDAARRSSTDEVLRGMARTDPLLLTDPARR